MSKYAFKVKANNVACHLDIEKDLKVQREGVFTFTIRINQGCIMDYVNYRNVQPSEYGAIFSALEPECEITRSDRTGRPED